MLTFFFLKRSGTPDRGFPQEIRLFNQCTIIGVKKTLGMGFRLVHSPFSLYSENDRVSKLLSFSKCFATV